MEPPTTFEADALRDEKVKVLRAIGDPADPSTDVVRGQYGPGVTDRQQVEGYREEEGRRPQSETRRSRRPAS